MVDAAIEAIWDQHILSQPAVDFCINKYNKVMQEFDEKIHSCRKLNYKNDLAVRIKAKIDAKKHYHKAKLWCISFFLLNHKQAIQSIKYKNKIYIGRAGVKESDGKNK